ncbi:hypothetical protein MPTK1_3g10380 [Marchantia polymorpha subsp. ruderalis]|uniref:Uncharacterized protein n=2 Tax=Marchantia polymorpha TaxID=3197 RepID=A0A176VY40_MARPO|nr:hypothetical protein AXG93_3776s1080 [Marchantia polymorpha subsp. ruderalis]PTQ27360.1 hypothetical protein MARPO_0203s0009 [Marchantia polymorpha]BBN05109.1 hypothetical protein Mp_3g10380 [Marchantia polymorpha subsp. ruderalis]|eukprot:PTQ27360.1 hypothetical protein MARPO_0203s0009 [Marchantia polymorpha]
MGSLMAGWQSKPLDARQSFKRSTSSLTNDEVKRFWRAKQNSIRRHLREATSSSSDGSDFDQSSPPLTPTSSGMTFEEPSSFEKADWWTMSKWAFLNQPPISDTTQSKYRAQFEVVSFRADE